MLFGSALIRSVAENMTPAVGMVKVDGAITEAMPCLDVIKGYRDNDRVKAVIVRINSPGGEVGPSQEIYQALLDLTQVKPVIASLSSVGASGAYYIACGTDMIYALPGTMVGSLGVVMEFIDVSNALEKIGVRGRDITSGQFKDAGSPLKEMTPADIAYFTDLVQDVYEQFIEMVSLQRGLSMEQVRALADGRVFTGRQALSLGLVDRLGGFNDALKEAKLRAGLKGEVRVLRPRDQSGWMESLKRLADVSASAVGLYEGSFPRVEYMLRSRTIWKKQ